MLRPRPEIQLELAVLAVHLSKHRLHLVDKRIQISIAYEVDLPYMVCVPHVRACIRCQHRVPVPVLHIASDGQILIFYLRNPDCLVGDHPIPAHLATS